MSDSFIVTFRMSQRRYDGQKDVEAFLIGSPNRFIAFDRNPFSDISALGCAPAVFEMPEAAQAVADRIDRIHIGPDWRAHDAKVVRVRKRYRQVLAGFDRVTA